MARLRSRARIRFSPHSGAARRTVEFLPFDDREE
jgi:hypothetical protein